ncbi:MAG: TrkA family potassium uptake protein [Thermoplasmata archaeon]|jgi:trk system potassium uptake protein TrkA|nr:TrkA family potassium uptake protein [Thermoplasmata archaeon]
MYLIIVGAGEIGEKLITLALRNKDDVVVIEKDKEKCTEISKKYDVVIVNADATEKETLMESGADNADALIATADDATNLLVISLAKSLGIPSLVSLVNNEENEPMFIEKGVNIVGNPAAITAEYLYNAVLRPMVKDFMTLGNKAEIFKIKIPINSKVVGKQVGGVKLPRGVNIIAIERNDEIVIPSEKSVFKEGDVVTLLARKDKIDKTMNVFFEK